MSNSPDGGQDKFNLCPRDLSEDKLTRGTLLPCEMIKPKPDRISRLARSTNLSKILEGYPPERFPFGIEVLTVTSGCPRTWCARPSFGLDVSHRRFCANFLNLLKLQPSVNLEFTSKFEPLKTVQILQQEEQKTETRRALTQLVRGAKYQRATGNMPAPLGRTGDCLLGLAMACSL